MKAIKSHFYENIQHMPPIPASQFPGPSRITRRSECPSPRRNPLQGQRPHLPVTARAPARLSCSSKSTQDPFWPSCPAFSLVTADCQADWVRGCQDIWSDTILAVPVSVFLDEMNIWIGRLSNADGPLQYGWASPNQLKARMGQKGLKREDGLQLDCLRAETSDLPGSRAHWPVVSSPVSNIV